MTGLGLSPTQMPVMKIWPSRISPSIIVLVGDTVGPVVRREIVVEMLLDTFVAQHHTGLRIPCVPQLARVPRDKPLAEHAQLAADCWVVSDEGKTPSNLAAPVMAKQVLGGLDRA